MPEPLSFAAWTAEGVRRFGEDNRRWRFVCPVCGHVASVEDWWKAGAPGDAVAFSCTGRWTGAKREAFTRGKGEGPCNYAGGGLFRLNPVGVVDDDGVVLQVFAFADEAQAEAAE
jgi:hypothetical protein